MSSVCIPFPQQQAKCAHGRTAEGLLLLSRALSDDHSMKAQSKLALLDARPVMQGGCRASARCILQRSGKRVFINALVNEDTRKKCTVTFSVEAVSNVSVRGAVLAWGGS